MKKYIYIIALVLFNYSAIQAQIFSDDNFLYKVSPKKAVQGSNFNSLTQDEMIQSITYFDGLGRPVQEIALKQGGTGGDIVTHMDYDTFDRQEKEFLPFAVVNPGNNQKKQNALNSTNAFYNTVKYDNTLNAFSQKEFEASPLNRVVRQAAPGNDWKLGAGHEIKMEYKSNAANEVRMFTANTSWDSGAGLYSISISANGYYPEYVNNLYKTITYDENTVAPLVETNGATIEFKNKEGQVVLKRTYGKVGTGTANEKHDTYYVYDIYGNLTYVIPPKAADLIVGTGSATIAEANLTSTATVTSASPLHLVATNSISLLPGFIAQAGSTFSAVIVGSGVDQVTLDNLCYQYKYDHRNRLVEKKLPGKQWEYIVYDKLDRPVLTQDANLRAAKKWLFTKYDVFGRIVYTGEYTNTTKISRAELQLLVNASPTIFEIKQGANLINGTTVYYSNNAFPNSNDANITLFTINYYDDYNFDLASGVAEDSYGVIAYSSVKGLLTGSKVRILGKSTWITNVNYYDHKGRIIYNYSKNDFLLTTDKVKSKFDFTGTILETTTTHLRSGSTTTIVDSFSYDQTNRLVKQTQAINGASVPEIIVANTYDDLGQLISKKVGGTTPNGLQTVDLKYNIRGWLKNINDINAIGNDLFAFQINYNDITDADKKLFNGNISQTLWKTANSDSSIKNYVYSYDKLNRLTNAVDNLNKFNESLNYDKNGNITKLVRLGEIVGGNTIPNIANPAHFGIMDNLDYTYDAGNKLQIVSDSGNKTYGFKDDFTATGADTTVDYTYDDNGNMKTDTNKEITNIVYNHLNLPTQVTIASKNIDYLYDAAGVKQQKTVNNIVTDYVGKFIYENNELKFFSQPEGYVAKNANSFEYIYQYNDHLGNIRLSYDKNLAIQEENNYYPFGLKHKGYNNVNNLTAGNSTAQKYKYNGKELQDELGLNTYDYGARFYDPATGRWYTVDAMAEKYTELTPYNYVMNNPVIYIDPDGNEVEMCCEGLKGFLVGISDNVLGRNDRGRFGGTDFNNGARAADIVSVIGGSILQGKGLADITSGTAGLEASLTVTAASGGLAVEVTAPAAAVSGALIGIGAIEVVAGGNIVSNAMNNLKEDSSSNSSTTTHGNSKSSTKAQHNYDIEDTHNDNKVVKTGISSGKETKAGESYRGKSQANKWNKNEGTPDRYKSKTTNRVQAGEDARKKALDYEVKRANKVRSQLDPTKHSRP